MFYQFQNPRQGGGFVVGGEGHIGPGLALGVCPLVCQAAGNLPAGGTVTAHSPCNTHLFRRRNRDYNGADERWKDDPNVIQM